MYFLCKTYITSNETKRIDVPGFGFVDYTPVFKYLGTLTHFDLKDDKDVAERCKKAWCIMGSMKDIWDCPYIEMKTKYLYFIAMPIGLLLLGAAKRPGEETELFPTQSDQKNPGHINARCERKQNQK
jgi:hypothetical protein